MTKQEFIFVPYWVESAMTRNSLPMESCLEYAKVRGILSLEDTAGFLAMQNVETINFQKGLESNGTLFNMWSNSITDAQRLEFTQAVAPMSCSIELKQHVINQLDNNKARAYATFDEVEQIDPQEVQPYKILDITGDINLVVIYKGFNKFITLPENQYKFLTDLLKLMYMYMKPFEVSVEPIFKQYLEILSLKSQST